MNGHRKLVNARRFQKAMAFALAMTGSSTSVATAAPLSWNNAAGGSAGTSGNWSPSQVPGPGDDLTFNLANVYSVSFSGIPTVNSHTYKRGTVTLSITGTHTSTAGFDVADANLDFATLNLTTGTLNVNTSLNIGVGATSAGTLRVNDNDAFLNTVGISSDLFVGRGGVGTLEVTGGGRVTVGDDFIVGSLATALGNATVSGFTVAPISASTVETTSSNGDVVVGLSGDGQLSITSGGVVHSARDVSVGQSAGATGSIAVSGQGLLASRLSAAGNLLIGRHPNNGVAGGTGDVAVSNQGLIDIDGTVVLGDSDGGSGVLHVGTNGRAQSEEMSIESGGRLEMAGGTVATDVLILIATGGRIEGFGIIEGDVSSFGGAIAPTSSILTINGTLFNSTIGQIAGGKIHFGPDGGYMGSGTCNSDITGDADSRIEATGTLQIGANTSAGFSYHGETLLNGNTVTLLDSNGAVLGGRTLLQDGTLQCANGIGIQNGARIEGAGALNANVVNSGALNPEGATGGTIDVQGNLFMNPTGAVEMTLHDAPATGDADRINVNGTTTFNGSLRVNLGSGFIPRVGQQFIAVNASAGRTGEFATIVPPAGGNAPCNQVTFVDVYSSTAAIVLIRPPLGCTALGDLNSDGGCNAPDVQIFTDILVDGVYDGCADMNGDCANDLNDIPAFLNCLLH